MKLKLILVGAVVLCASAPALEAAPVGAIVVADNDGHHHQDNHPQGGSSGQYNGANGQQGSSQKHSNTMMMGNPSHTGGNSMTMGNPNHMGGNTMMMGGQNHVNGNAMWGQGNNNHIFDRRTYQHNFTANRHFHAGGYIRPAGWYYRRWVFGEVLPAVFWSQNYWIGDYYDFGLPPPPPGYVWVRYGDDALLVNQYTGEVLQVEYGLFD